ncbi:MAG TPA: hypothetical protein VGB69_12095 [Edaphobacter sp.]
MRFQTLERLPGADPEAVLRAMETGLLEVSTEVVREGRRITLAGLGPSPRVKNRRDRTVIDVKEEDGVTTVAADVTYQASAVLGTVSQNAVVQEKLERVFDGMWAQLGLKRERGPVSESFEAKQETIAKTETSSMPEAVASAIPPTEVAAAPEEPQPQEDLASATSTEAELPSDSVEEQTEAASAIAVIAASPEAPEISATFSPVEDEASSKTDVPEVSETKTDAPPKAIQATIEIPRKQAPLPEAPKFTGALLSDAMEEKKPRSAWGAWAVALVLLVAAPAVWFYLPHHPASEVTPSQEQQIAPPQAAAPAASAAVPAAQPGSEEDPAAVVKDWEAAMQSTDAAKQAAFYADPVDRYFLRHDVSRQSILEDKQASISKREGDWALAMERVAVRQQEGAASVHLVKHFSVRQNGKLASQWFIPSQLLLKRTDGRWQIVSERDFGWATSLEELDGQN